MKVTKQATTKTSFLALSGSKISIVVTGTTYQNAKAIMMWIAKTSFFYS